MFAQIWITQLILAIALAAPGHELLPEKYLKPRNFNHHPYTDVGISAALKKSVSSPSNLDNNPFDILEKLRTRESRDYSNENLIYYPTVPHRGSERIAKKIDTNHLPKNYAFTYTVKDLLSGDDFSHSQAHNGKATKGEYRVKLPDGRTQIVSYTADHKGYRADVQYEDKPTDASYAHPPSVFTAAQVPTLPLKLPEALPQIYRGYQNYNNEIGEKYRLVPLESASGVSPSLATDQEDNDYTSNHVNGTPVEIPTAAGGLLKLFVSHGRPVAYPNYYKSIYLAPQEGSHQESPPQHESTTPVHYVTPTAAPQINHISSTSPYPADSKQTYHIYPVVSSTVSPSHAVLVTPRTLHHHKSDIKALNQSPHLYKLLK